jgi:pimeloyl-ACP methyl ester carboxylesterase
MKQSKMGQTERALQSFVLLMVVQLSLILASCSQTVYRGTVEGSGDVPIVYEASGSGSTALIFVHGWSCDRSYWRKQVAAFTDTHIVVTLDLGGHGDSPATRNDWSIESFGEDVAAVASVVDADHFVLIGHSMSGRVVLDAAKRLKGRVAGIVGVDTLKAVATGPVPVEKARTMFSTPAENFPARMDSLVRRSFFTEESPPELVDYIARDMAAGDPVVAMNAGMAMATYDIRAALHELEGVPLILINSDQGPTDEEALEAAHPGSRLVVIPHTGHFVMLEQAQAFNEALRAELKRLSRLE